MSKYRVIQLTNKTIGAVAVNGFMPFGNVTRKVQDNDCGCCTFNVTTSNADTVNLNEIGNYDVMYSASLTAGAAGEVVASLIVNGVNVYEVSVTAASGDVVNVTLPYQVRVCPNCAGAPYNCPVSIQVQLTGVAITAGTSNMLIERVY